ncbi:NIPSNAP family protein [Herbaspirillum frisingense]|uniref:NIPSNAP family protein n=1 Tax=Herbaspirillum frisingense TaxID=92645 RepID=UPI001F28277F|nr:NIPSNAP family protein [Herbaspirillum frisingense]UIN21218.1 NIPSNAP family protein [Herbaspirillum frisingense]
MDIEAGVAKVQLPAPVASVFEMRSYDMVPSRMDDYLNLVNHSLQEIRRDQYGRLVGFWRSGCGAALKVHHLWEFTSLDARQKMREELARREDWIDFLRNVAPCIQAQSITFLRIQGNLTSILSTGNAYQLIRYQARVGKLGNALREIQHQVSDDSVTRIGIWAADAPDPNEVWELLAVSRRTENEEGCAGEGEYVKWIPRHEELVRRHSTLWLVPISISPLN